MRTFLYIDGFNLYYSALKDTPLRWLNPVALATAAFPRNHIVATKFFTAKVTPLPHDPRQPDRQNTYWRALRTLPALEIIEGDFRTRKVRTKVVTRPPNTIVIYKTEEKGSDVNLGAHLLMDGFLNRYEAAIVITGDSDLVTPIQMACRKLKKPVGVLNPQRLSGPGTRCERKSAGLQQAAAFYKNGVTPRPDEIIVPERAMEVEIVPPAEFHPISELGVRQLVHARENSSAAGGIALASFILSLFFFVPYLNFITALMSLIFGHLALSQTSREPEGRTCGLAILGLWISYTYCGFLSLSMAFFAFGEVSGIRLLYLALHGQMLAIGVAALIGSGLLMLVIKLITGHLIRLGTCFMASLLPAALNAFGFIVVTFVLLPFSHSGGRVVVGLIVLQACILVFQMFFWSRFIRLPGDMELGLPKAALASLFQVIFLVFIGFLYGLLQATVALPSFVPDFLDRPSSIGAPTVMGAGPDQAGAWPRIGTPTPETAAVASEDIRRLAL